LKNNYEQFLEVIDRRVCRVEMGRRMLGRYCCVLYCVLVTWVCALLIKGWQTLKLLIFFLT